MPARARISPLVPFGAAAAALTGAVVLASQFPAVEGLGTKVRLPVFHGALTWANLVTFGLMAIAAIVFLATRRAGVYRYEAGLRWVSVPMWLVGSAMGLWAALGTWDLTGSKASAMTVVGADPRLMAQFWTLIAGAVLLMLPLFVDRAVWIAAGDIAFTAIMSALMLRATLGPGRSLHPDSPVLNSSEIKIKLIFFGMFGLLLLAALLAAWGASLFAKGPGEKDSAGRRRRGSGLHRLAMSRARDRAIFVPGAPSRPSPDCAAAAASTFPLRQPSRC